MSNTGFIESILVKTSTDPIAMGDLKIGDKITGYNETTLVEAEQTVEEIRTYKAPGMTVLGSTPAQQIWMHGKLRSVSQGFPDNIMGNTVIVELTVTPDHTFLLADGLRCHNGGAAIPIAASAAGGIASGLFGGGGDRTTTQAGDTDLATTSTRTATPGQQNLIDFIQNQAISGFQGRDLSPFAGKLSAGPTAASRQANQLQINLANQLLGENRAATEGGLFAGTGGGAVGPTISNFGMQQLRDLATKTARGDFLTPESNPFIQANIDIINRNAAEQAQQALAANRSQAIAQGAFGGSGNALQAARVQQNISQGAADRTSQIALENFNRERAFQNAVGNIFGQAQGIEGVSIRDQRAAQAAQQARANASRSQRLQDLLRPIELLRGAGAERQGFKQGRLDARLKQDLLNRQLTDPFQGFNFLLGAAGPGSQFGTTTGTQFGTTGQAATQPGPGLFSNILSGAAGAGGLATSLLQLFRDQENTNNPVSIPGIPITGRG